MQSKYASDPHLTAAWNAIAAAISSLQKKPSLFIKAAHNFFERLQRLFLESGETLGGDEYGDCIVEFADRRPLCVTLQQAKQLKRIAEGLTTYNYHVLRSHVTTSIKRHDKLLNAGYNQLQLWFYTLAQHVSQLVATVIITPPTSLDEMNVEPDYLIATELIDYSEDYFFECSLYLAEELGHYLLTSPLKFNLLHPLRKLLDTLSVLLFSRTQSPIKRFTQLALACATVDELDDAAVHQIISTFIERLPPGVVGYRSLAAHLRQSWLQQYIKKHDGHYQQAETVCSLLLNFRSDKRSEFEVSLEDKVSSFPNFPLGMQKASRDYEDYFFFVTLELVQELTGYVLKFPEATITHDRQHEINIILKKAIAVLLERRLPSSERFKSLINVAITYDSQPKGELKTILERFIRRVPGFENYKHTQEPLIERLQYMDVILQSAFFKRFLFVPSALSDEQLQIKIAGIPFLVLKHLDSNHEQQVTPFWKFLNWFKSLIQFESSLFTKLKNNVSTNPELVLELPDLRRQDHGYHF